MKRRSVFPLLIYLAIGVFVIWLIFNIFGKLGNSIAYSEVLELFDELRTEFVRFQEGITRARQRLNQAESELDAMETRARKINKKLM